jgi:hypothetical protein
MKKLILLSGLFIAVSVTSANAQATPGVNARQGAQRARIAEGVRSDDLSKHEARELKMQQRHIRRTEHRAKSDGVVTPGERAQLDRKQDRANRNIARKKRN